MTSEEFLGLPEQPHETCPAIVDAIKELDKCVSVLEDVQPPRFGYRYAPIMEEEKDAAIENVIGYLNNARESLEAQREENEKLRAWGQDWKDEAKSILPEIATLNFVRIVKR